MGFHSKQVDNKPVQVRPGGNQVVACGLTRHLVPACMSALVSHLAVTNDGFLRQPYKQGRGDPEVVCVTIHRDRLAALREPSVFSTHHTANA